MSWKAHRVDWLDLGVVAGIALATVAHLVTRHMSEAIHATAVGVLVAPASIIVLWTKWNDFDTATYRALQPATGAWKHVRRWLPPALMTCGLAGIALGGVRLVISDGDLWDRYARGVMEVLIGLCIVSHGRERVAAQKPVPPQSVPQETVGPDAT